MRAFSKANGPGERAGDSFGSPRECLRRDREHSRPNAAERQTQGTQHALESLPKSISTPRRSFEKWDDSLMPASLVHRRLSPASVSTVDDVDLMMLQRTCCASKLRYQLYTGLAQTQGSRCLENRIARQVDYCAQRNRSVAHGHAAGSEDVNIRVKASRLFSASLIIAQAQGNRRQSREGNRRYVALPAWIASPGRSRTVPERGWNETEDHDPQIMTRLPIVPPPHQSVSQV
ncbi:hypothetical protein EJ07DRAFT_155130 [Lizonia empirigonia]|nr:hypothetical protein EJ07DRAFT_155130 [Lizonia empirigonia]